MLTVDELLNVLLMEQALGGPMRPDDCPTVLRDGGFVRPHDPYPPTRTVESEPKNDPIIKPSGPDNTSDPF